MHEFRNFDFGVFFDALHDEVVVLDNAGVIIAANTAWKEFCAQNGGDVGTYYVGTNYVDICGAASGPGSAKASLVSAGLRRTLTDGTQLRLEYPCDSPTRKRWFEMTATRLFHAGQPCAVVQHRNISLRKDENAQVADAILQAETLAALVATSNDAILSFNLDGNIVTWNRAAELLYGYTAQEAVGKSLEMLYPEGWPKKVAEYRDEISAGRLTSFEATRIAKSGQQRLVWVTAAPVRGADGAVALISNIHRDITEARKAQESRDIIAQEVMHRAKNMLTVVGAIHRQTARTAESLDDFKTKFGARIQALSTSTDLLVSGNWTTVDLADLVRTQTGPLFSDGMANVTIDGPPILLQPQAVQVLGMALHELATNSAKYGALRHAGGQIAINWTLELVDGSNQLIFDWNETSDSDNGFTDSQGFGSTVLTALSNSMLDAQARYDLKGGQVQWNVAVPAKHFSLGTAEPG